MDGPDELEPHTWMGFSTGRWDGDRRDRFQIPEIGTRGGAETMNQSFLTSSNFKREPNGSKFKPTPCKATT